MNKLPSRAQDLQVPHTFHLLMLLDQHDLEYNQPEQKQAIYQTSATNFGRASN